MKKEESQNKELQKKEDDIAKETSHNEESIEEAEMLNNLPPEVKRVVEMGFSMQRISGPMQNPLMSKINEKHIDKILELAEKEENNSFSDAQSNKRYGVFYFIAILLFVIFLIIFLIDRDKALLLSILEKAAYILGGFGGGYGLKSYLDNKKKE